MNVLAPDAKPDEPRGNALQQRTAIEQPDDPWSSGDAGLPFLREDAPDDAVLDQALRALDRARRQHAAILDSLQ